MFKGIFMCSGIIKKCKYRTEHPSLYGAESGRQLEAVCKGVLTSLTTVSVSDTTMEISVALFFMSLCVLSIAKCVF